MINQSCSITNGRATARILWLEPWADQGEIRPGATVKLIATSDKPGEIHIEDTESTLTVYGWPSSRLTVVCDDDRIWESHAPAPSVPTNMDMRSFVKFMFHPQTPD